VVIVSPHQQFMASPQPQPQMYAQQAQQMYAPQQAPQMYSQPPAPSYAAYANGAAKGE
jgi:hypothetical protein